MIALDTNILLRYLTADEPTQFAASRDLIETRLSARDPGFVSIIVLVELVWVMQRALKTPRASIVAILRELLAAPQLVVEHRVAVASALDHDTDIPDAIIHEIGRAAGCRATSTFDRRFAALAGVELLDATA